MFNKQVCFLCTWERPRKTATSRNGPSHRLQHHLSGGQGEMVGCGASRGRGPEGSGKGGCSSADPSPRPGRQSREEFPGTWHPLRVQGRGAPRKRKCLWQKRDFHSVVRASPVFCFLKIISLEESSGRRGIFGGGHTPLPFTFLGFCLAGREN